jgi:histone H3/H4
MPGVAKSQSRQARAGVTLSVARLERALRYARVTKTRVDKGGPIFLAGSLEHLAKTLLEGSFENARSNKSKRVHPIDVITTVRSNPDLARMFGGFAFSSVMPSKKPIDFILPQEGMHGQKMRKAKIKQNKAEREAKKGRVVD